MSIDAIRTTEVIRDTYLRYLLTAFPISDRGLIHQFKNQLNAVNCFVKGPILEATPSFCTGKSVKELSDEGILSSNFNNLDGEHFPIARPLYEHQEKAILKTIMHGRNIVITTGTGSGKTEAFLIPILQHLFLEEARGLLCHGVRALILYPMNALANDQLKRLRRLLSAYPKIKFGRYTGETKKEKREAEDHFRKNFPNEPRIPNELLSREEMRDNPPHILLTNYAMLEYLLLRPDDCEFFDGEKARYWRFIVIDEIHTYDGAKGIEMAMLIRRLKDRIVHSEQGRLQCIATSATLGRGRGDYSQVMEFASQLFGESFCWKDDDQDYQDVVEANRLPLSSGDDLWGEPDKELYKAWCIEIRKADDSLLHRLLNIGRNYGVPVDILNAAEAAAQYSPNQYKRFLYEVLRGDITLHKLHTYLEEKPQFLNSIASRVFPLLETDAAQSIMTALVDLAVQAKPDDESLPLLPARYHLFVRALEGAYISLAPEYRLYIDRRKAVDIDGCRYPVFEMALCRRCGAIYLVGATRDKNGYYFFEQSTSISEENMANIEFYLVETRDAQREILEDEDEMVVAGEESITEGEWYILCAQCGSIERENLIAVLCSCQKKSQTQWRLQKVQTTECKVNHCPACGVRSPNLVGRFLTGQDAPVSVLSAALYQQIPAKTSSKNPGRSIGIEEDQWGAIPTQVPLPHSEPFPVGRQMLIFSDSRQDAAFFSCYLSRTYSQILRRRLIVHTLELYTAYVTTNHWRVQDLVEPLRGEAEALSIFPREYSRQEQINDVWKWLMSELMAIDRRNSLEGLGCVGFTIVKPTNWIPPRPLLVDWNLSEEEAWTLYQVLLDSFRFQGALTFPESVSPEDEAFAPRNREYFFRNNGAVPIRHIFSWSSSVAGRLNRRLDFLLKLAKRLLRSGDIQADCKKLLRDIWERGLSLNNTNSIWRDYFSQSHIDNEGVVYRLRHNFWEVRPVVSDTSIRWHRCDTCGNLTLHNLRNVCTAYRCDGTLSSCDLDDVFIDNHYRQLYHQLIPMPMRAEEHTAQLKSEAASQLQDKFVRGEINVLSCSTTFELGVDVGELEVVLMRNMPPSTANYVQRAGRAGRRTDSTAFVVTFAQRRSHDLTYFNEPERMISGKIRAPYFEFCNEKIIRRHIYAIALSEFWKENPALFGTVESFFFPTESAGPEAFLNFLENKPESLQKTLDRVIPSNLKAVIDIREWLWVKALFDENSGVLKKATDEIRSDVRSLEAVRSELISKQRRSDHILWMINTLKRRTIIDFLSNRNVLPKYGFPVDVVELQILHHGEEAQQLELSRDLRIAISEYAPESEVVAGGRLWTSYGLKRLPNREWPKYQYAICGRCHRYQRGLAETGDILQDCLACGSPLEGRRVRSSFIIPEFGFITNTKPPGRPGDNRPVRTVTTRVYFSGETSSEEGNVELQLGSIRLTAKAARNGRLAVINRAGFKICHQCGFAVRSNQQPQIPHRTPWGQDCRGTLIFEDLGHEFQTDVLDLRFEGYSHTDRVFWLSLLYALLEGASEVLNVRREDIDGCLYPYSDGPSNSAMILFDDVPGGAGHVRRLADNSAILKELLYAARAKIDGRCGCSEDTSCYGCIRSYRNQFCHDDLKRGVVLDFVNSLLLNNH